MYTAPPSPSARLLDTSRVLTVQFAPARSKPPPLPEPSVPLKIALLLSKVQLITVVWLPSTKVEPPLAAVLLTDVTLVNFALLPKTYTAPPSVPALLSDTSTSYTLQLSPKTFKPPPRRVALFPSKIQS